ncbi:MAG: hypothetical protein U0166_11755 [Acidobacteriota bacterium]
MGGQDLFLELCWLSRAGGDWDRACFRDRIGAGVEVFRMGYEALGSADRIKLRRALPRSLFWEYEGFTLDLPNGGVVYATEPERRRHDVHLPTVLYPGPTPVTVPDGWSKDPCRTLRHAAVDSTARRTDDEDEGAEHVRELRSIVVAHSTGSPREDWGRHVLALPGGARLLSRELVKQPSGLVTMPVTPGPGRDELDYPIGVMARKLLGGQLFAPSQRKGRDRPALRWLGIQDRQLLFGLRDALHALDLSGPCKVALLRQIYVNVERESKYATESVSVARSVIEASVLDLVALRQVLEPAPAEERKGLDFEVLAYSMADEGIEDLQCIEEILDEAEAAWECETDEAGEPGDGTDEGDEPISGLFDGLSLVDAATLSAPPPADPPLSEARHVVVGRWGGESGDEAWGDAVVDVVEALRKAETPKAIRDLRPKVEALRGDRKAYWLARGLSAAHLEQAKDRRNRAMTVRVPAGQAETWRKLRGRRPLSLEAKLRRAERRRDPVAYVKALRALRDKESSLRAARRDGELVNEATARELAARIIESKLSDHPFGYSIPAKADSVPSKAPALA